MQLEDIVISDDDRAHVAEQLVVKTWEEMEVLEHAGHLLFREKLWRRTKAGKFEGEAVRIRVPREPEHRAARKQAREICVADGIDPEKDRALLENVEIVCVLAMALRSETPPHEPHEPDPRALERRYDRGSLTQLYMRVNAYAELIDPRPETLTKEEVFGVIAAISKGRRIAPLLVYGGAAQSSCIVTMADLSLSYLALKSSSESSEPSTPEPSPPPGSSPPSTGPTSPS